MFTSIGLIGEDPGAAVSAASAAFSSGDTAGANASADSVAALMTGAADSGRTRVLVGGLAGAGVLALGAGGVVAVYRRRRTSVVGQAPPPALIENPAPPPAPPYEPSSTADPYATLGDPRPPEPIGDRPVDLGHAEGDDR